MKYKAVGMIGIILSFAIAASVVSSRVLSKPILEPVVSKQSQVLPSATNAPVSYKIETYNSSAMGETRTYGLSLPPDYEHNTKQRYPVIFLLHGGHGTPTDWFNPEKGAASETLQQLYASGKLPPSIVITPDGNDHRGSSPYWDPEYIDGPNGKVSTAIGDELVKVIQSRYRTLPAPNFWAIGGLSSGGWGALNVGLHHRNHFSVLFSHSGYFRDSSGVQNSPINFVRTLSPQERRKLRIYLDTGTADVTFLNENREFQAVLKQLKITNVFREFPGEHTWRYWRQHLDDSLTFVGKQFQSQG